jgi:predicted deacylase
LALGSLAFNIVFLSTVGVGCLMKQVGPPVDPSVTAWPAAETSTPAPTVTPSPTAKPSETALPSAQPTATLIPTETPTPTPQSRGFFIIGFSVGGRPLEVYQFGSGPSERLIVAGIHGGNEWNTIALADELIAHLRSHPEIIPADITLYILPNLNPDGEARGHGPEGRTNDHGVDLNRNWPANWQSEWPEEGCWTLRPVSAGKFPVSGPETKSLQLFLQHHKIDALISYHSAALGIFPGGLPPDKNSIRLAKTIAAVSTYPYPPIDTGCQFTGALVDWASWHGIAALDIELTNHTDTDFEQNLWILNMFMNWKT